MSVRELSEKLNINPHPIWRWFQINKVPKKYFKKLSNIFGIEESYINKKVNDLSTYKPKTKGFSNSYEIDGDITYIYIITRKLEKYKVLIDTEDLPKLIQFDQTWYISWSEKNKRAYIKSSYNSKIKNRKKTTVFLHRFIMDFPSSDKDVDHLNHNFLDNRKQNLKIKDRYGNAQNRKGANKNSSTGVRNVNLITKYDGRQEYWVQFMKKGEKFKWEFPINKFKEACEFAEKKRKELFGDYKEEIINNKK